MIEPNGYENYRQRIKDAHLRKVIEFNVPKPLNQRPCLHNSCQNCKGTGVKQDGTVCVHMISCPCPKCSPTMRVILGLGKQRY
jgi:hypothetical protein